MARRLRSNRENGWYHVFHRGIERRDVFLDDRDREHFLKLLGAMSDRCRVAIHAFSLMDNHWHGVEQVCGETRRTWQEQRGGDGKALAMWATQRYGGLTLRETGEAFSGLADAGVGSHRLAVWSARNVVSSKLLLVVVFLVLAIMLAILAS